MSRKGGYTGGSTTFRLGSDWFSYSDPEVDSTTGETRADQIKRIQAEAAAAKAAKKRKQKGGEKTGKPLNASKEHSRKAEERRMAKIERNRARLAEQEFIGPPKPSQGAMKQQALLSRLVVEKRKKKKLIVSKARLRAQTKVIAHHDK